MNRDKRVQFVSLILIMLMAACWRNVHSNDKNDASQALQYVVLDDRNDTSVEIGIRSDVNEAQLRATLVKAANDHQDDPARDYLSSPYLWIDAYLIKDGRRSDSKAGVLRRIVPFANPEERKRMKIDRTAGDKFEITLDKAQKELAQE